VANWGNGWLLSRADPRTVSERVEELYPHLEKVGRDRSEIDLVVTKGLSIGKTHAEAVKNFYASMLPGRMDTLASQMGFKEHSSQEQIYEQNLIGTPEEIQEQLINIQRTGVDHCVIFYFAVNEYQQMLEQTQWFGEEILPILNSN
jgi:alkanesulfonate monooxygenase SsuD/methylene tetrahydromethanopterin reductase-like flavin-dependent oxidoreductase (luciferase family)